MELLLAATTVAVAAVLMTSGLEKLRAPAAFFEVLRGLGLSRVRGWWAALCAAELLVVVVLLTPVPRLVAALGVAGLGTAFAGAGVRALRLGRTIRCACFGQPGQRSLGRPQLLALPLWLGAAAAVYAWAPATTDQRAAVVAGVFLLVLGVPSVRLAKAIRSARADRLAVTVPATRPYPLPEK